MKMKKPEGMKRAMRIVGLTSSTRYGETSEGEFLLIEKVRKKNTLK